MRFAADEFRLEEMPGGLISQWQTLKLVCTLSEAGGAIPNVIKLRYVKAILTFIPNAL